MIVEFPAYASHVEKSGTLVQGLGFDPESLDVFGMLTLGGGQLRACSDRSHGSYRPSSSRAPCTSRA